MASPPSDTRELHILEHIETNPEVTQADLAEDLGVAVGTINFAIQRLIKKGYVRVTQLERRRLKYIITPAGIALRTKLAMDSLHYGMQLYRETRAEAKRLLLQVKRQGHTQVTIQGKGDIAEIVRLTCLELKVDVAPGRGAWPVIEVSGASLALAEGS